MGSAENTFRIFYYQEKKSILKRGRRPQFMANIFLFGTSLFLYVRNLFQSREIMYSMIDII